MSEHEINRNCCSTQPYRTSGSIFCILTISIPLQGFSWVMSDDWSIYADYCCCYQRGFKRSFYQLDACQSQKEHPTFCRYQDRYQYRVALNNTQNVIWCIMKFTFTKSHKMGNVGRFCKFQNYVFIRNFCYPSELPFPVRVKKCEIPSVINHSPCSRPIGIPHVRYITPRVIKEKVPIKL